MQLQQPFDATQTKPAQVGGSQLSVSSPEGHPVIITASDILENSNKQGGHVAFTLQVTAGQFQGETGIYRLNLYNNSAKAVEIAFQQLSALCFVTNVFNITDTQQLHNIPFNAVVGMQKGENPEGYTEIKGVLHSDGSAPGKSTGAAATKNPPQQPAGDPNAGAGAGAGAGWQQNNQQTTTTNTGGEQQPPAWAKP